MRGEEGDSIIKEKKHFFFSIQFLKKNEKNEKMKKKKKKRWYKIILS